MTAIVFLASFSPGAFTSDEEPMARIRDNSFLVEEAYNQEEGIVSFYRRPLLETEGKVTGDISPTSPQNR